MKKSQVVSTMIRSMSAAMPSRSQRLRMLVHKLDKVEFRAKLQIYAETSATQRSWLDAANA